MKGEIAMKNKEKKFTMQQVHDNRKQGYCVYGIKKGYCGLVNCCDYCNKRVRFWCKIIAKIEEHQTKIIKKICK